MSSACLLHPRIDERVPAFLVWHLEEVKCSVEDASLCYGDTLSPQGEQSSTTLLQTFEVDLQREAIYLKAVLWVRGDLRGGFWRLFLILRCSYRRQQKQHQGADE